MTVTLPTPAFHLPLPLSATPPPSPFISPSFNRHPYLHPRPRHTPKPTSLPHLTSGPPSPTSPHCALTSWDTLTAAEFHAREASSALAICFIGMSNCGKSHWSRQLKNHRGYHVVSVDEQIERAIEPELRALGYAGIQGLAEWMGFPSDSRFEQNQHVYLTHEERITGSNDPKPGTNNVLDTTGSVIYLKKDTLERIRRQYLVVHLEASDDMLEMMTSNYFQMPKPVVWGDAYRPKDGEEPMKAMRRCYPDLLRERRKRYAAMAHVTVPASVSLGRGLTLDDFLAHIHDQLG